MIVRLAIYTRWFKSWTECRTNRGLQSIQAAAAAVWWVCMILHMMSYTTQRLWIRRRRTACTLASFLGVACSSVRNAGPSFCMRIGLLSSVLCILVSASSPAFRYLPRSASHNWSVTSLQFRNAHVLHIQAQLWITRGEFWGSVVLNPFASAVVHAFLQWKSFVGMDDLSRSPMFA